MNPRQVLLLIVLAGLAAGAGAQQGARELIEQSLRRHAPPAHVYEEQALVLADRQGQNSVRTVRYYALRDASGSKTLRVIETPADAKGTAIYVARDARDDARHGAAASSPVFGSGFSVADLEGEQPQDFRYERDGDHDLERVPHYVLRAIPAAALVSVATGYHERRIYLRKDNLYISRIDYLGADGRPARRQTFRDPRPDESGAWRPGMILMEDLRDGGRALLKVERRVHSPDYVPPAVFAGLSARP
jgi:hypothetical protein